MTFSSIVKKNFNHNFNKYISFYFVNSLIIAMLFMYGSLLFNKGIIDSINKTSLYETVQMALLGVILFSIVFISYTNIAFLKNRGKEFGMYLTLGMTTKDLTRLIFLENLGIMIASLITGILGGSLFARLFYMGLNRVLNGTTIIYEINYKSFLLSIGVFTLIFLGNFIFNIFYIRKVSIIDIIKASKSKEVGTGKILLGIISFSLLAISMYCLPKTLLAEIFKEKLYMSWIFAALTLICPYMIIQSFIVIVKELFRKFPNSYNKNILVLSNVTHRFSAYRNMLYILSLLIAGAMFFMGYSYSIYTATREFVNETNPYDIMFVETEEYNKVDKEDLEKEIKYNKGEIKKYDVLDYIEVPRLKAEGDVLLFYKDKETVISETNYNKHMGTDIDIKPNESLYITVENEVKESEQPNTILVGLDDKELEKFQSNLLLEERALRVEEVESTFDKSKYLYLDKENIVEEKKVKIANFRYGGDYYTGDGFILDDKDYEFLKNNLTKRAFKKIHLINVKNGDVAFEGIRKYLMTINKLDDSYWADTNIFGGLGSNDEIGIKEAYRPIYKEELVRLQLDSNGIMFFTMIFIGMLFVVANGVILYYKVLSDIGDENERINSLKRIGITAKEINSIVSKELAIIFFMPTLIGGGMGLYYLYVMISNSGMTELLMNKSVLILVIGYIFQYIFYLISRKKYIKEINV